jgi:hypothetical protein
MQSPMNRAPSRTSSLVLAGLIVVCSLGLALRLRGIGYLLPTVTQLDGSVIVHQIEVIRAGTPASESDPHTAYYPQLLARVASLFPEPGRTTPGPARELGEHLKLASAAWVQARIVSVLLSIWIVPATWFLARRFLSSGWSLLAAALCATSLLHVVFSSQERPHGTAATFSLLAVLAALRLRRNASISAFVLVGVAAGLAIGSLHYGAFVLCAVVAAVWLRDEQPKRASAWWSFASFAIIALCVRWLYPFHFTGNKGFLSFEHVGSDRALNLSGQPLFLDKFDGTGFLSIVSNLWSYDPVIFVTACAGVAFLAARLRSGWSSIERERRCDLAVVLAYVLPYFLVIGMYAETWERFLMPLIPYLACLGAFGAKSVIAPLVERMSVARARTACSASFAALLPALALVPAVKVGCVRASPNTLSCAAEWIEKNASVTDPIVVVPYVDLPLLHADEALAENSKRPWSSNWIRYQMQLTDAEKSGPRYEVYVVPKPRLEAMQALTDDPLGYFREFHARYVVIVTGSEEIAMLAHAREALRREAELVYRVTPERVDAGRSTGFFQRHLENVLAMPFFLFVLEAARMGPTLEIYRLNQ